MSKFRRCDVCDAASPDFLMKKKWNFFEWNYDGWDRIDICDNCFEDFKKWAALQVKKRCKVCGNNFDV